jgi:hypothetical protein
VEVKTPIVEVLKKLKLIGVTWEPQPAIALIADDKYIHCKKEGETFITKVEESGNTKDALIEIKEISKDKVILKYENEEGFLTLTE